MNKHRKIRELNVFPDDPLLMKDLAKRDPNEIRRVRKPFDGYAKELTLAQMEQLNKLALYHMEQTLIEDYPSPQELVRIAKTLA